MAVELALDSLSSLLTTNPTTPAAAATSHGMKELEDLRMLERTMRRIHATLRDAEQHWNTREKSAKLRLEELKELAYDAEEAVDEYEYEVTRRKVEVSERRAAVQGGGGGDGAGSSRKRKLHKVID
ncbi:hypothetical protein E2562_019339 [Oryza meyeriana var. granulata]|uniref:Disease resistance N-terminal domain-containing protein n=1 Tax=Oryza meyeriana var. granulata TaxID=110450 RepID=A0A6G1BLB2_9ORYZ|nr:hypothetical protein E2562_019339 [Oryza meyeriana var. granulata]